MKIPFSAYDTFGYLSSGALLIAATDYALGSGWILGKDLRTVDAVVVLFLAYIIGHIVANLSSYCIEHKFVRQTLISPEVTLFEKQNMIWTKLFPIFYKPFPEETQQRVLDRAKRAGFDHPPGRGLFFHCHACAKADRVTLERLNTFQHLYGFCRNTCMAALLTIPLLIYTALKDWNNIDYGKLWGAAGALAVSIGMLYRYLKFFRHYTLEVFQTYAELPIPGREKVSG